MTMRGKKEWMEKKEVGKKRVYIYILTVQGKNFRILKGSTPGACGSERERNPESNSLLCYTPGRSEEEG